MDSIADKLDQLRKQVRREWRAAPRPRATSRRKLSRRGRALQIAARIAGTAAIVALPFIAYVRSAVFFYRHSAPTWIALALAALVTLGIVALPTAAAWCLYSAVYLARVNAKSDAVHGYYSSVHPILRTALSTIILFDDDLVITDTRRVAADYPRMGLPVNERTLHFDQRDGYVHAVDLRTRGHNEFANRLAQLYFWSMGFSTLRHVGTADHLHVQLPFP